MIAPKTNSAVRNNFIACKLQRLSMEYEDAIFWNSQGNHTRCFGHKLALLIKHSLDSLKLKSGHINPTTQPKIHMLIPIIRINRAN